MKKITFKLSITEQLIIKMKTVLIPILWLESINSTIFGEVPDVALLIQPGIRIPLTLKVTLDATSTFAFIAIGVLKLAEVTFPASTNELKFAVITASEAIVT